MKAIYAGTFDPLTHGHADVIIQTIKMFGNCNVVIGNNRNKTPMFNENERFQFLNMFRSVNGFANQMEITIWNGLTIDAFQFYCWDKEDMVLVRGVRNMTDMIAEMALADINEEIGDLKTVFIPTSNKYRNFSSSAVKELWSHDQDVSKYCPPWVIDKLKEKR